MHRQHQDIYARALSSFVLALPLPTQHVLLRPTSPRGFSMGPWGVACGKYANVLCPGSLAALGLQVEVRDGHETISNWRLTDNVAGIPGWQEA